MIKVIEGLEPWEVMKRASEGEKWVFNGELGWAEGFNQSALAHFISDEVKVAIIDTTTTEIDWDKFDWDFFNQYGGLLLNDWHKYCRSPLSPPDDEFCSDGVSESPFYYWAGGEQPVPNNVEVEVVHRDSEKLMQNAKAFNWSHQSEVNSFSHTDIIAFRLTGKVVK